MIALHVKGVLGESELAAVAAMLEGGLSDGAASAAALARAQKRNLERLAVDDPAAVAAGRAVTQGLAGNPYFQAWALPGRMSTVLFNRYDVDMYYGDHFDNPLMDSTGGRPLRSDLAFTLFLSDPASYDGGELVVNSTTESQIVKLPAGDAVVYLASSIHRVNKVTRGSRRAAVGWIESLVRDPSQREILFDLRLHGDQMAASHPDPTKARASMLLLEKCRANLLRMWAET